MSEAGSNSKSVRESDAEYDLLSKESLIRPLTSKEQARLVALQKIPLRQTVMILLEKDAREDGLGEEDEDAAEDD